MSRLEIDEQVAGALSRGAPNRAGRLSRLALLAALCTMAAVLITRGIGRGEFNINVDECYHACTGEYFADFLRAHPIAHPIHWTYQYYAHYPAVAVGHWPPLFAFVLGVFFLIFGASVVVSRLVVLAFALFGLIYWFKLAERSGDRSIAFCSALLFASLPFILLFEKSAMLEIPALAFCIAATYYWLEYLRGKRPGDLYAFAVMSGLALLTKENSVYLIPFCVLTLFAEGQWRLALRATFWKGIGLVLLIAGPFYVFMFSINRRMMHYAAFKGSRQISDPLAYYLRTLPRQLTWPLLILAIIGMITAPWWAKRRGAAPMFVWVASCFFTFNLFAEKAPRYIIEWIPPLVYFAVAPLLSTRLPRRLRRAAVLVLVAVIVFVAWRGWTYQRPYVSGYEAAARQLMSHHPQMVLLDSDLAGNFIFFVRKFDPARRCYVMRKGLYVEVIDPNYASKQLAHSPADIEAVLRKYGVKYIVAEQNGRLEFPIQRTLRQLLRTPQFQVEGTFPVTTNVPRLAGTSLVIYKNLRAGPPLARDYRVPMMTLGHDIVAPLGDAPGGVEDAPKN